MITVLWDVAPYSLVETDRRFRDPYCFHHHHHSPDDGGSTCETSVNFYETTRRNISKDGHLHTRRRENLKYKTNTWIYNTICVYLSFWNEESRPEQNEKSVFVPLQPIL
jgi:hypothetical protein